MADKRIDELEAAASVTTNDLFVLEQAGTAKKLEAQTLENWLLALAQGHGGITGIAKTGTAGTNPVVDTYTITFSDTSTTTFDVTNGVKGDTGDQTYVYIKYSNREPIADSDLTDTPSAWMGICATTDSTAPTTHTSYSWYEIKGANTYIKYSNREPIADSDLTDTPSAWMGVCVTTATTAPTTYGAYSWYEIKGDKGDPGNDITIASTSVMYQAWSSGTQYPTGTWLANPPAVMPGNYLWTRTIVNYSDGGQTVSYSVGRWGLDGSGAVVSVNSQLPDQNGNVTLTASDVGALPDSYQPPVTSVNNKTGTVVLDNTDVNAPYHLSVQSELASVGWYRVLSFDTNETIQQGSYAFDIDLCIKRSYNVSNNEMHKVSLLAIYQNIRFGEETSVSNQHLIQGIRYTRSSTKSYIDIRYASNSANNVDVDFTVHAIPTMCSGIKAETLQLVADAPTGETVVASYVPAQNCIPESKWLAWENSSPTAGFAAQTVSVDLSRYSMVEIEFTPYADDTRKTVRCPVGKNCNLFFMFINTSTATDVVHSLGSTSRSANVTTSGITFGNGQMLYDGAVYQDWTNRSIPTKIWAIR